MKDYFEVFKHHFTKRRSNADKRAFVEYVKEEAQELGYECRVECLEGKHNNVLIGNVESAEVVFCAHYDTPAASLFPNLMMPRSRVLGMLYQCSFFMLYAFISIGIAFGLQRLLHFDDRYLVIAELVPYFLLCFLATRCFDNKNNQNDNTSGVVSLLSMMAQNKNQKIAFVLFDNEEKGKLGSKAFEKAHKDAFAHKLVINLDCVGNGNEFIFVHSENAAFHPLFEKIKTRLTPREPFAFHIFPAKKCMSNSDHKNFAESIGVMACKKGRLIPFYTPRIHTVFDTVSNKQNVEFMSSCLLQATDEALTEES